MKKQQGFSADAAWMQSIGDLSWRKSIERSNRLSLEVLSAWMRKYHESKVACEVNMVVDVVYLNGYE